VLVANWLRDVTMNQNPHADQLLVHFYRWLCDTDALLHDPALRRLIQMLMSKVFMRLVAELRRLGARVIFANFHRVIIATNKADVASAREYADFVVNTVVSREIFECLQIEPTRYWEQLLFMDEENHGGIEYRHVTAQPQPEPQALEEPQVRQRNTTPCTNRCFRLR
jgi:DNA polymerase epsilon subunit 1